MLIVLVTRRDVVVIICALRITSRAVYYVPFKTRV